MEWLKVLAMSSNPSTTKKKKKTFLFKAHFSHFLSVTWRNLGPEKGRSLPLASQCDPWLPSHLGALPRWPVSLFPSLSSHFPLPIPSPAQQAQL
jgi:hypothetical protein